MNKITKTWKLPAPEKGEEFEWRSVVRVGRHVPFGYEQDPNDLDILLPISNELNLLEDEYGISPGQACVFYSKDEFGDKVLGGGWIRK